MLTRKLFFLAVAILVSAQITAQISEGGQPLSMDQYHTMGRQYVPQIALPLPDIDALIKEDSITMQQQPATTFRIGTLVAADINITDGVFTTLDNGDIIWQMQIKIPGADALGLYYDQFFLPKGVKYFLTNGNKRQVLGAYTANNNPENGIWANEKVQGDIINLELNVQAGVDIEQIKLHINNVCVFYRATDYLDVYSDNPVARKTIYFKPYRSSACQINAMCPEGDNYPQARKATVHIEFAKGNSATAATGTMVNNTAQDCKPYILTAMHSDATNSTSDATFANWLFYFNYETPSCDYTGTQLNTSNTMTGGSFRARSTFQSTSAIAGDFLLLELKNKIPAAWDVYLAGWDHSGTTPTQPCVSFHHPVGDVKKIAVTKSVSASGNYGAAANSHWELLFGKGGVESGSSGSGLFDNEGRLIGDLSGGLPQNSSCTKPNYYGQGMGNYALYSKLSFCWTYDFKQPSSATTRLKDWLDPLNTGANTLDAVNTACIPAVVAAIEKEHNVAVYPNPSNGIIHVAVSSTEATVSVYNMLGQQQDVPISYKQKGIYSLDMSACTNGMYLISIQTTDGIVNKKIMLNK